MRHVVAISLLIIGISFYVYAVVQMGDDIEKLIHYIQRRRGNG